MKTDEGCGENPEDNPWMPYFYGAAHFIYYPKQWAFPFSDQGFHLYRCFSGAFLSIKGCGPMPHPFHNSLSIGRLVTSYIR